MRDDDVESGFPGRRSSESEGDSRTDDLIDTAAHAMTRGEPSALLRVAIRARVENRRVWPAVAAWVPALAAAAAVVIAVFAWWTPVGPPTPQPVAVATPPPARPPAPPQPIPRIETAAVTPLQAVPRTRVTRPARALDPIAPMVIEPMTTPLMAVGTSSGVMPIEIDDLRIEALQIQ